MNNKQIDLKYRKSILITLIIFASIIFVSFILIEKYILEFEFKKQILNSTSVNIYKKEMQLKKLINNSKNTLNYIAESKIFKESIDKKDYQSLESFFLTISQSNNYFMQLRFLDANGKEQIRINRNNDSLISTITPRGKLQDKSKRDYFIDSKKSKNIYISDLNLNIEHNKIEYPLKSTLRVIYPIIKDNTFIGELIVNLEINLLVDSILFDTMIANSEGKVILPFDNKARSFPKDLKSYLPTAFDEILKNKKYIYKNYITYRFEINKNKNVIVILKLKNEYFKKFQYDQFKIRLLIFSTLLIFIIIVIAIVYNKFNEILYLHHKSKLEDKVNFSNKEFETANKFLSKNIDPQLILSQASTSMLLTDENAKVLYINHAFTELFGYEEDEVLGRDPGFLRNEDLEQKGIDKLKIAIKNKESTTVILRNYTKDNHLKYVELSISPIFDEKSGKIIYFLGIHKDVTKEQKILKQLKRIF